MNVMTKPNVRLGLCCLCRNMQNKSNRFLYNIFNMSKQYRNIAYIQDSGCGFWRHVQQIIAANCHATSYRLNNTFTQQVVLNQDYYKGITSVTCQRWISPQQHNIFKNFLKPICDANQAWLIYAIDDAMDYQSIPIYNRGRPAYANDGIQAKIKDMLNSADLMVVTTDYIKQHYHKVYGVPLENIVAAPNLLPRWWFGDRYHPEQKVDQFRKLKAKPRIGVVSSLSHFNVDHVRITADGRAVKEEKAPDGTSKWIAQDGAEVKYEDTQEVLDDFDDIASCIRETVDDFQWVCFGYAPPQVQDLVIKGKIEVHLSEAILNYASKFDNLKLQAVVAPIKKGEFNYCKSHIKTMECAALGVPLFATNCLPYSRVMPAAQLFDTPTELKEKLLKLKFASAGAYQSMIGDQWKWLNTPCHEGDFDIKNYWLEDNLHIWIDMFRLRQKTINVGLNGFIVQYKKRKEIEAKNTIFKTESGMLITK